MRCEKLERKVKETAELRPKRNEVQKSERKRKAEQADMKHVVEDMI